MSVVRPFLAVVAAAVGVAAAVSCSDGNTDEVGGACRVIVQECDHGASMSDCIDQIGALPLDCTACIAEHGCDYATCERISGCRLPLGLMGK